MNKKVSKNEQTTNKASHSTSNEMLNTIDNLTNSQSVNNFKTRKFKSFCRIRQFDRVNNSFFKFNEPPSNISSQVLSVNRSAIQSKVIEELGNKFHFDYVFDEEFTQVEVFHETCFDLIDNLIQNRKSSLVMAQGLNDSGKTFTIVGDSENPGILPLSLRYAFDKIKLTIKEDKKKEDKIKIFCNYVEIYDNLIYDLLSKDFKKKVNLSNNIKTNIFNGANYYQVKTLQDFSNALNMGERKKKIKDKTSLSYTIFKLILQFQDEKKKEYEECSVSFIDFAFPLNKEFLNVNDSNNWKKIDTPDKQKMDLYYMHYFTCKVLKEFNDKDKKNYKARIGMDYYCPLLHYLRYYFYSDEDIVLITNIKPSLENTEENVKVLDFSRKLAFAIERIDNFYKELKLEKLKIFDLSPSEKEGQEKEGVDSEIKNDPKVEEIPEVEEEIPEEKILSSKREILNNPPPSKSSSFEEMEQMKKNMLELMKKFEEQQFFLKSIFGGEVIVPQKSNILSNSDLAIKEKINEYLLINFNHFKKIRGEQDGLNSNTKLFSIIFIRPTIEKLSIRSGEEKREKKIQLDELPKLEKDLHVEWKEKKIVQPPNEELCEIIEQAPTKIIANISHIEEPIKEEKPVKSEIKKTEEKKSEKESELSSTRQNSEKSESVNVDKSDEDEELQYFKSGATFKRKNNSPEETQKKTRRQRKRNNK